MKIDDAARAAAQSEIAEFAKNEFAERPLGFFVRLYADQKTAELQQRVRELEVENTDIKTAIAKSDSADYILSLKSDRDALKAQLDEANERNAITLQQEVVKLREGWGLDYDINLSLAKSVAVAAGLDANSDPIFVSAQVVMAFARIGKLSQALRTRAETAERERDGLVSLIYEVVPVVDGTVGACGRIRLLAAGIDILSERCGFPIVEDRPQVIQSVGNLVERLRSERDEARAACAALHGALGTVLESASPHPVDNPTMCKAWGIAYPVFDDENPGAPLVQELAALREERAWRPIESAPKDGTWILGVAAGAVKQCRWKVGTMQPDGFWDAGDWITYPTQWQPLPAAPGAAGGGR